MAKLCQIHVKKKFFYNYVSILGLRTLVEQNVNKFTCKNVLIFQP